MKRNKQDRPSQRKEKPQEEKPPAGQTQRNKQGKLVDKAIEKIEQDLDKNQLKGSMGDLIRLLQLKKELEEESPREIKVSWVEPREGEHAGEK